MSPINIKINNVLLTFFLLEKVKILYFENNFYKLIYFKKTHEKSTDLANNLQKLDLSRSSVTMINKRIH